MKINLTIIEVATVHDVDNKRCDQTCNHLEKINGMYCCSLFHDQVVDLGDDENGDYLFYRTQECKNAEVKA
jgi:hypothetical protein